MNDFWIFITNYGNYFLWFIALSLIVCEFKKSFGIYNFWKLFRSSRRRVGFAQYSIFDIRVFNFGKSLKLAFILAGAVFLRTIILYLIRFLFPIPRPFQNGNIIPLVYQEPSPSFPSGHASMAFLLATFIFAKNKFLGVVSFILASLVAYSRVYVGVHYTVDILAGALLGIISFLAIWKLLSSKSN